MKRIHIISFLAAIIAGTIFCSSKSVFYEELDPQTVLRTIEKLDSVVSTLYGFEPVENPGMEVPGMGLVPQEPFDMARETWSDFRKECYDGDFEKAYHTITEVDSGADWIVYLKISDLRCEFISNILKPMLYEFEDVDVADSKYLDIIEQEFYLEVYSVKSSPDSSLYVPETFPEVINTLAVLRAQQGLVEEALELLDVFGYAVNHVYQNGAVSNLIITYFLTDIALAAGDVEAAIKYWEDYKTFTRDNMYEETDTITYLRFMDIADKEIEELKEL